MSSIADILEKADRDWTPGPSAKEEELLRLINESGIDLPEEYLSLLKYCNGGEGALGIQPYWLVLDSIREVIDLNNTEFYKDEFPNYFFIGGNGGIELFAFDTSRSQPWPIVMIDPIAGAESAIVISNSMESFINAIGIVVEN